MKPCQVAAGAADACIRRTAQHAQAAAVELRPAQHARHADAVAAIAQRPHDEHGAAVVSTDPCRHRMARDSMQPGISVQAV